MKWKCLSTCTSLSRLGLTAVVFLFTVKEARARQIPVGLPKNLKNYFENALKKPPISNMFG